MLLISLLVSAGLVGEVVLESQDPLDVGTLEPSYNALFANKCIEHLGCFYTGPPFWDPLYRPISLPPADKIRTRFLLYTRSNQDEPTLLNLTKEGVLDSAFDAGSPTKILIHGYRVKLLPDDVRYTMKDELLKEGSYNVIIVNWTDSNQFPYSQAFANARVVGAQTAKIIDLLMENKGITPDSVHIIGHSLGGQVAGWAGERVPSLGRITGLDPAGPFFQNAPNEVRLDDTDAEFVDVIHSNGGDSYIEGLGIKEAIGDMDFYPNGGNSQPGCFYHHDMRYEMTDDVDNYVTNSCAHSRANDLFVDSINRCTFRAVECESYDKFEKGECDNNGTTVSVMGFGAQNIPDLGGSRRFYLNTDAESPFCEES